MKPIHILSLLSFCFAFSQPCHSQGLPVALSLATNTTNGVPVILTQPASQTNNAGNTATFSVSASGTEPLSYQWWKDGVTLVDSNASIPGVVNYIAGTMTNTLNVGSVVKSAEGGYSVVVSNAEGSVTSVVATLTVIDPAITLQLLSQGRNVGDSVSFTVRNAGTFPMRWQWYKDGQTLGSKAFLNTLTLTNLQPSDAGLYSFVVSNMYGCVTSSAAVLTINQDMLDPGFNPGVNGDVYSLAMQTDGKILVGGWFTTLAGQARNNLGRLNADGSLDQGFNPEVNGQVSGLAVQADGRILARGDFTTTSGQAQRCLARFNTDGTLDAGFTKGTNGYVSSLALQADGKILVGGTYFTQGGQTRYNLARLNADGTLDQGFNPEADSPVLALAPQADGKMLVGGYFTTMAGQPRKGVARLNADGTLDPGFNPEIDGRVNLLAVQADGKILVAGRKIDPFFSRLNADGTLDEGFNPKEGGAVSSVAVQADGKILVAGQIGMSGLPSNWLARLYANGDVDFAFSPNADGPVFPVALQADGRILVGGAFSTLNRQTRNGFARLNNTEPATQRLSYSDSTVTWLRGGTSPEVWRATFAFSTNGVDWISLGEGTRIPALPAGQSSGWQLAGLNALPLGGTLRAQGYVTCTPSSWFVETLLKLDDERPALGIALMDGKPALQVIGKIGGRYTIEYVPAHPPVGNWLCLPSFVLTNASQVMVDTNTAGVTQRFYRLRSDP